MVQAQQIFQKILKEQVLAKEYISPIRFFKSIYVDLTTIDNSRLKKIIIAEFAIADAGVIIVDNNIYNKNDILNLIEDVNFNETIHFHEFIWENKSILELLEKFEINYDLLQQQFNSSKQLAGFSTFVSPYLAISFNQVFRKAQNESNSYDIIAYILRFEKLILTEDREFAFNPLRHFLDSQIKILKNITSKNYHLMRPQAQTWVENYWFEMVNKLPLELDNERNELIHYSINLSSNLQK
jgi:hypothetical protein